MVLGHRQGHAICLKATSNVEVYKNNPEKLAGCIFYKGGETNAFPQETVVQPDNPAPISHAHLVAMHQKKALEVCGQLPSDFVSRLTAAIEESTTLNDQQKERLLTLLRTT